jgi:hypothetical protein
MNRENRVCLARTYLVGELPISNLLGGPQTHLLGFKLLSCQLYYHLQALLSY